MKITISTPMKTRHFLLLSVLAAGLAGCQPRTPGEKAKDAVEDAAHETGQGVDRAGEKVKDAAN
jgi:hypothetical protein